MKINNKMKLGILTALIILIGMFIFYQWYNRKLVVASAKEFSKEFDEIDKSKVLSKKEVTSDTKQLIDIIENTHPFFILEGKTDKYKKAKAKFVAETSRKMTKEELKVEASKYLSSIEDAHTEIQWQVDKVLDVNWKYINNKLVILDNKNKLTGKIVTKINGVEIDKVFKSIDELFPAENYVAVADNYSVYSKYKEVLGYSGVECTKDINLTVTNGASEENIQLKFLDSISNFPKDYELNSKKIDQDTVYVKFGSCVLSGELEKVIEDLELELKEGIKNVIIDVTDNPGGSSEACKKLLEAINVKPGDFGSIRRYSELAQEKYGLNKKSGYESHESSNDAVPNPNISLYVITNEETFSSAQWLATWVKDGKLGTIIGRPSKNMPSSYGDAIDFELKNSKLKGQVSFTKWTRPDKSKDSERVLEPDIYVDYSENPLDKALEVIASKKK
ncbi:S41 family peptidase [Clostridium sp. C8-1-8]|uniref:S41 family peptidase n=1 Tax=Clostridium sp. C8-1-8 TaxID=2698831 RepID=UPI00136D251B|nr:S41 family peptidase [Clostridium sp. C8-1-8]